MGDRQGCTIVCPYAWIPTFNQPNCRSKISFKNMSLPNICKLVFSSFSLNPALWQTTSVVFTLQVLLITGNLQVKYSIWENSCRLYTNVDTLGEFMKPKLYNTVYIDSRVRMARRFYFSMGYKNRKSSLPLVWGLSLEQGISFNPALYDEISLLIGSVTYSCALFTSCLVSF